MENRQIAKHKRGIEPRQIIDKKKGALKMVQLSRKIMCICNPHLNRHHDEAFR